MTSSDSAVLHRKTIFLLDLFINSLVWHQFFRPILKGLFAKRDRRFVTQAIDGAAHRGYQRWHRDLDDEVVSWIRNNRDKNGDDFLAFLKSLYERPDIKARFPNGF